MPHCSRSLPTRQSSTQPDDTELHAGLHKGEHQLRDLDYRNQKDVTRSQANFKGYSSSSWLCIFRQQHEEGAQSIAKPLLTETPGVGSWNVTRSQEALNKEIKLLNYAIYYYFLTTVPHTAVFPLHPKPSANSVVQDVPTKRKTKSVSKFGFVTATGGLFA